MTLISNAYHQPFGYILFKFLDKNSRVIFLTYPSRDDVPALWSDQNRFKLTKKTLVENMLT